MNAEDNSTIDSEENAHGADESTEVENELEADTESTDDESEGEESDDGEGTDKEGDVKEDAKKAHRNGFKKRLDREKRKLAERDQEIDFWKKEALKRNADPQATETSRPAKEQAEPNPEDYDTNAEYIRAYTKWELKLATDAVKQEAVKAQLAEKSKVQEADYSKKVSEFATKTQDFEDVVADFTEIHGPIQASPRVLEAIRNSEFGAQIPYEIMKTPGEYERLCGLSEDQVIWEIAKKDARLALQSNPSKPVLKTSKAPAPASTIGKGSASTTKSLNDPNISFSEYERLRKQQLKK